MSLRSDLASSTSLIPAANLKELLFDIESNGLLVAKKDRKSGTIIPPMDRIHCISIRSLDGRFERAYGPDELMEALHLLMEADVVVGHNIVDFDLRAIKKIYPWFKLKDGCRILDTLIIAKVICHGDTLKAGDEILVRKGLLPPQLRKSQSLKAWGIRLGNYKEEYDGGWETFTPEMLHYMHQDTSSNLTLFRYLCSHLGWAKWVGDEMAWPISSYVTPDFVIDLEHELTGYLLQMSEWGWGFNIEKAAKLAGELGNLEAKYVKILKETFGSWWEYDPKQAREGIRGRTRNTKCEGPGFEGVKVTIRKFSEKTGKELKPYVGPPICEWNENAPYTPIKRARFNPTSRNHLSKRLMDLYGWVPTEYGENGQPTVDEVTLKSIPESVLPKEMRETILNFLKVEKTLGQLSKGAKAWLKLVRPEGTIHHSMDPQGTVTGRGSHKDPNLGQVPAVQVDKETHEPIRGLAGGYGYECRELFEPCVKGWEQTGIDQHALELVMLGQYLYVYDGGAFLRRAADPDVDIHQEHAALTGLTRYATKTVTYTYVYGGGDWKVGIQIPLEPGEKEELLQDPILPTLISAQRFLAKKEHRQYEDPDDDTKAVMVKGRRTKRAFEAGITGIADLKKKTSEIADQRKWLKAIDGRKLWVRKAYSALNTLLQGGGAIACKIWVVLMCRELIKRGWWGTRVRLMAWVHDETQWAHEPGLGPELAEISRLASIETSRILGMKADLLSDAKTGSNWAVCH